MSGFETIAGILGAAGTAASAVGTIAAGSAERKNQNFIAKQEEMRANEELAASQREAQQNRNEAELAMSRQQALAASSGGGAGSEAPTIVRLMTDTAGQGELNASTAIYGGQQRAAGLRDSARGRRAAGKASFLGSVLGATGTAFGPTLNATGITNKIVNAKPRGVSAGTDAFGRSQGWWK